MDAPCTHPGRNRKLSAHDGAQALGDFGLIEDRVRVRPWSEAAIRQISAIQKPFRPGLQPRFFCLGYDAASRARENRQFWPVRIDHRKIRPAQAGIRFSEVIKRSVKFYVVQPRAFRSRDFFERGNLLKEE